MMNPVPWLQMTNMISYQGLVRTFPKSLSEGPLPVIKSSGEIYRIHHWFDICPKGAEANVSLSNIEAPVNKVTRHSFDSREAAIMHILMQKETVKKSVSGDRSNTPEGVDERWY